MAAAKKCDRCGILFELKDEKYYEYGVAKAGLFQPIFVDLCPKCKESLNEWFKNVTVTVPIKDVYVNLHGPAWNPVTVESGKKKRWWKK